MRQSGSPRTFRVKSFGCQMNVYDGERMAELLADKGMSAVPEGEDADLVVLNTCHIREKAAEKVYSDIGRLVKTDGPSRGRGDHGTSTGGLDGSRPAGLSQAPRTHSRSI